jgi:SAM-dependent methyltransferase
MPEAGSRALPCPLCGGVRTRKLAFKFGRAVVRCRECGFGYATPPPDEAELLARYESQAYLSEYKQALQARDDGYDADFISSHYHLALGVLAKQREQSAGGRPKLLDIGAGLGLFLKAAEGAGWEAEGVEISKPAAAYALRVAGARVHPGPFRGAAFAAGEFDAATLLDTLEHLEAPVETLREVFRILKPGGMVLVQTPDLDSWSRKTLGKNWAVLSPAEHLGYFTGRTLARALGRAGFEAETVGNLLIFDPEYAHRKRGWRYRIWRRRVAGWETRQTVKNIHGFERLAFLSSVEPKTDPLRGLSAGQKRGRCAFLRLKRFLRGDILLAVGRKPGGRP